jgi:hypothetical protein
MCGRSFISRAAETIPRDYGLALTTNPIGGVLGVLSAMVVEAIRYMRGLIRSLEDKSECSVLFLPVDTFPRRIHDLIRDNGIQDLEGT